MIPDAWLRAPDPFDGLPVHAERAHPPAEGLVLQEAWGEPGAMPVFDPHSGLTIAWHDGHMTHSHGTRRLDGRCVSCGERTTRLVPISVLYGAGRYDGTMVCAAVLDGTFERLALCGRCGRAAAERKAA